MKRRTVFTDGRLSMLIRHYLLLLALFIVEKPLFMLYAGGGGYSPVEWLEVMRHGLSVDLSVAGYLTCLPLLMVITGIWWESFPIKTAMKWYDGIVSVILSLIFCGDCALYPFWGTKLDASVFFYLKTPGEAMASISVPFLIAGLTAAAVIAWLVFKTLTMALKPYGHKYPQVLRRVPATVVMVLLYAPIVLAIRGGLGESTMNVGHAYFSTDQFLNHSAVNPAFSLLSSMGKSDDYASYYDYFDEEQRAGLFEGLFLQEDGNTEMLLKTRRPNVLLMIMEGYGGDLVERLGGTPGVSPCLDRISREGVFFENCYAGSYRTDRGVVCILNGHPGLPVSSYMKMPVKSATLPSFPSRLAQLGYDTEFMYGGDINFTNMQSYLWSNGYRNIISDTDFTPAQRHTNAWGVNDDITFSALYDRICGKDPSQPWMTTFLSLSSHEPFDVPFNRFEDKIPNSFAYTDSCLGSLVDKLKSTPVWDSLLVVIIPDHGFPYPQEGFFQAPHVRHIPAIWTGGAVREPRVVECLTNQYDMAATLLAQMGLDHSEFGFSRNVLSSAYERQFVFYTYNNGFCFIDSTGVSVYDDDAGKCVIDEGPDGRRRTDLGKAILQTLYDDLGSR